MVWTIICGGCAVIKRTTDLKTSEPARNAALGFYDKVMMHNITRKNFYISKASIVFERNGNALSGFASIKYKAPDKYLISIRTFGGFEVIRAFLSGDTLLVNDRINRKLLYGKPEYLKMKFGIDPSMLPVIFGDFYYKPISEAKGYDCKNGLTSSIFSLGKYNGLFTVDCDREKVITTSVESAKGRSYLLLNFNDFSESGDVIYPKSISVEQKDEQIKISIDIKNIEYSWEGEIEFIPGAKYEKVELI